MSALKPSFIALMLLVSTSLLLVSVPCAQANVVDESEAVSALATAEAAVVSAYEGVAKADEVGANVSGLLVRLNEAGELLTRAHLAYRLGNFDSALDFAVLCEERLSGFTAEADALRGGAIQDRYWNFLVNVVGSILGTVAVIFGGFVAWSYLNRKYAETGSGVH